MHLPFFSLLPPDKIFRSDDPDAAKILGPEPVRAALFFAGVLLPFLCFLGGWPQGPHWQSGEFCDYFKLLLWHVPSMPLYPFLLFNMTSMALLVSQPVRYHSNKIIRFGIFSGVPLALEYWIIFQVAIREPAPAMTTISRDLMLSALAVVAPLVFLWLGRWLTRRFYAVLFWLLILVCLVATAFSGTQGIVLIACFWCSTLWAVAAYAGVSIMLIRQSPAPRFRFTLAQLFGVTTWFAAHCSAWRAAYLLVLRQYALLPTTAPSRCFICTATARGHRRVVRSEAYAAPDGTFYRVNDQLRRLKAFELLLEHVSPLGHRVCRWIYDRLGPELASAIVHPLLADAGYFALKPLEWLARACLFLAIPGQTALADALYKPRPPTPDL